MISDLAFRASSVDEDLSILINVAKDMYTMGVYSTVLGIMYVYSSTSLEECYSKVSNYIDCLTNSEKMDHLMKEVAESNFEV